MLVLVKRRFAALKRLAGHFSMFSNNKKGVGKAEKLDELFVGEKIPYKHEIRNILQDADHVLLQNRNRVTSVFFRVRSKALGHKNPLLKGRACQSDTEWLLVQANNAMK